MEMEVVEDSGMEIQRTIKIRLHVGTAEDVVLSRTVEAYTACFNAVARYGWEHRTDKRATLHKATYYPLRTEHPEMKSQLVISACNKACEALTSAFALAKKHQARIAAAKASSKPMRIGRAPSCPTAKCSAVRYDARSYKIDFAKCTVGLCTVKKKRLTVGFRVPGALAQYITWTTASADLCRDVKGRWWLHVVVKTDVDEVQRTSEVLGVDLGIVAPAWDSENRSYGNDHWKTVEAGYAKLRAGLQAKGTKSAKRHLRKMKGRQQRFRRDCDHVLSKHMVSGVEPGAVIVMEDLTGIRHRVQMRKEQRARLHQWSFAQLQAFVIYKAQGKGVRVERVDPRYTSQTCSHCGHCARANRPSQAIFCCRQCEFSAHADFNAALNIRAKYLTGLPVNQPIVSIPSGTRCKPPTSVGGC